MRKAAVRDGDKTTSGGVVIASLSGIYDGRKKVALDGEKATCGNCKGAYQMLGTGKPILNKGRHVVLDGDPVMCPCGKNRVIVGINPRVWIASSRTIGGGVASVAIGTYDEQVRATGRGASEEYPYFIETADGRAVSGRLANGGHLPRVHSDAANNYTVYWGDDALAKQNGT